MTEQTRTTHDVAREALAALAANDAEGAARSFRTLVHAEPGRLAWRMRLADVVELEDEAAADRIREAIAVGAAAGSAPLEGLVAALSADMSGLKSWFAASLSGSAIPTGFAVYERPPLPTPPAAAPELIPGAELPDWAVEPAERGVRPQLPLLSALDLSGFAAIVPSLSRVGLSPGEALLHEGAPAKAVYLIADGAVEIFKSDPVRGELVVGRLGAGALVGEIALTQGGLRSAGARAVGFVEAVRIEIGGLREAAATHAGVGEALAQFTQHRLLVNLLRTSVVFGRLPDSTRAALVRAFRRVEMVEDELIVQQGEAGSALSLVAEGLVAVERDGTPVATLGAGQVFGEMALLSGEPASATVIAAAAGWLLQLGRAPFEALCAAHPEIVARLADLREARLADNRFIFEDEAFFEPAD